MGRLDVEARLVALRHPGLEEQDGTRIWFDNCLGNLDAPCDLISKRGGIEIELHQAELKIPQPPSFFPFPALSDFHLSPNEKGSRCKVRYLGLSVVNIQNLISIAFLFRLYVTSRDGYESHVQVVEILDHMSCYQAVKICPLLSLHLQ